MEDLFTIISSVVPLELRASTLSYILSVFLVSVRTFPWSHAAPSVREPAPPGARSAATAGVCSPPPNVSAPPTAAKTAWTAAAPRSCWAAPRHPTPCLVLTCSTANRLRCTTAPRGKVGAGRVSQAKSGFDFSFWFHLLKGLFSCPFLI